MEKESKYKSKKITVDGIKFDSKAESKYYEQLKIDKATCVIADFDLQPVYVLQEKFKSQDGNIMAITYKADFIVRHLDGTLEVVDVKGMPTETANIKRKLFLKTHPHLLLSWVSYVKKYGGFVDHFELKKLRKANIKVK